jgi:hypothetical protein
VEYDWKEHPFRKDPLTGRMICFDCWHRMHGAKTEPCCLVHDCQCLCSEAYHFTKKARAAKASRTRAARKQESVLKDESNPLRAVNPEFRGARG